jgi:alkanesulfonate monooxygenase SsuD/methylene tetrahydromethanopterin reductase-like flavin-dependent oxidoreductase (luciferase family)
VTDSVPIRTGVLVWNQYTDWPAMRGAAITADRLGYDSLWTWDHLYPIIGSPMGPILEGYMMLAGWSQVTTRSTLGLMVGANTFRNPGLVVKMVTALDHLSGGRAVLGLGAAWFDTEHTAFGIEFGQSVGERLDWLDEAVEVIHGMLRSPSASARGVRYHATDVRNDPPPVQERLPILIGGSGEQKTLRTIARFADAWNAANLTPEEASHKDQVLRRWCDEVGRDTNEIERTLSLGPLAIRDDPAEADRLVASFHERNPGMQRAVLTGSSEQIAERARAYVALGFRHIIYHLVPPYDDETLVRFATEVTPALGT